MYTYTRKGAKSLLVDMVGRLCEWKVGVELNERKSVSVNLMNKFVYIVMF